MLPGADLWRLRILGKAAFLQAFTDLVIRDERAGFDDDIDVAGGAGRRRTRVGDPKRNRFRPQERHVFEELRAESRRSRLDEHGAQAPVALPANAFCSSCRASPRTRASFRRRASKRASRPASAGLRRAASGMAGCNGSSAILRVWPAGSGHTRGALLEGASRLLSGSAAHAVGMPRVSPPIRGGKRKRSAWAANSSICAVRGARDSSTRPALRNSVMLRCTAETASPVSAATVFNVGGGS